MKKKITDAISEVIAYRRMWFSSGSFSLFHVTMVLMILSWLALDVPFFLFGFDATVFEPGGIVYPVRIFHRYVGALFVVGFALYGIELARNKRLRRGLSLIDYTDFVFMLFIVVYGVAITLISASIYAEEVLPYTQVMVGFPGMAAHPVPLHIFIVYGWFATSFIFSGAIMKAVACILLVFIRAVSTPSLRRETKKPSYPGFDNLTRFGLMQMYSCGKCGDCLDACPVYEETQDENLSPRGRLLAYKSEALKQRGILSLLFKQNVSKERLEKLRESLYACTMCGRCMTLCPNELELIELWKTGRESMHLSDLAAEQLKDLSTAIAKENNIYEMPHESRTDWKDFVSVDIPVDQEAETVYFVGCMTSYSGRLTNIAQATSSLLSHFDESWTILSNEWCCGAPLELGGITEKFEKSVKHNVEAIEALGAKRVVFGCPACYRTFRQVYPKVLRRPLPFESIHVVEYLDRKLREGHTEPPQRAKGLVTYHDPCELSRLMSVCNEPRMLISQFAEDFVEMPENKNATRCCGAGGVMKALNPDLSSKLASHRIEQAAKAGVNTLLSACPACFLALLEAKDAAKLPIRVADISELVAEQLGLV